MLKFLLKIGVGDGVAVLGSVFDLSWGWGLGGVWCFGFGLALG